MCRASSTPGCRLLTDSAACRRRRHHDFARPVSEVVRTTKPEKQFRPRSGAPPRPAAARTPRGASPVDIFRRADDCDALTRSSPWARGSDAPGLSESWAACRRPSILRGLVTGTETALSPPLHPASRNPPGRASRTSSNSASSRRSWANVTGIGTPTVRVEGGGARRVAHALGRLHRGGQLAVVAAVTSRSRSAGARAATWKWCQRC